MDTKLIFVDLDFTLLRSDGSLSERTINTIKKTKDSGILIGICTSRGFVRTEKYVKLINPDIVICNAGGSIYLNNKLIKTQAFTITETNTLLNKIYSECGEDIEITVDTVKDFYWNKEKNKTTNFMPEAKFHNFKNFSQEAFKICIQCTEKKLISNIEKSVNNCLAIQFSDIPWYKFSPKSATKENGILYIADLLKIPLEKMISFGDDFADMGMLALTGIGVAMENAIPEVKAIAKEITSSCDNDGVANFLEKNILNNFRRNK